MSVTRIGILLFDGVELLDFAGPYEVFTLANRVAAGKGGQPEPLSVFTVAERRDPVQTSAGLRVLADYPLDACPEIDILVIPGGPGSRREIKNASLLAWIAARARESAYVTSVCTGALLLGAAGLLDGKEATTHWAAFDELAAVAPAATAVRGRRVVHAGTIITSAGISAGIDLALVVVGQLLGDDARRLTAERMEYPDKRR